MPHWPLWLSPHVKTAPLAVTAAECRAPAEKLTTECPARPSTARGEPSTRAPTRASPIPSCPNLLDPSASSCWPPAPAAAPSERSSTWAACSRAAGHERGSQLGRRARHPDAAPALARAARAAGPGLGKYPAGDAGNRLAEGHARRCERKILHRAVGPGRELPHQRLSSLRHDNCEVAPALDVTYRDVLEVFCLQLRPQDVSFGAQLPCVEPRAPSACEDRAMHVPRRNLDHSNVGHTLHEGRLRGACFGQSPPAKNPQLPAPLGPVHILLLWH